jgi:hypothetical protein
MQSGLGVRVSTHVQQSFICDSDDVSVRPGLFTGEGSRDEGVDLLKARTSSMVSSAMLAMSQCAMGCSRVKCSPRNTARNGVTRSLMPCT